MQWAAVTTYLEATRVPPQNWAPLELTRATIQGYLFFCKHKQKASTNEFALKSLTYRIHFGSTNNS